MTQILLEREEVHIMRIIVTDKYKCLVTPYKQNEEDTGNRSALSSKYQALKSVERELRNTYGCYGDILFLTDNEPQSLYPYLVLKEICSKLTLDEFSYIRC